MNKLSIRKISFLGLVLMAASAVTAAVLPKSTEQKKFVAGDMQPSSDDGGLNDGTCVPNQLGVDCSATVASDTSTNGGPTVTSTSGNAGGSSSQINTTDNL